MWLGRDCILIAGRRINGAKFIIMVPPGGVLRYISGGDVQMRRNC